MTRWTILTLALLLAVGCEEESMMGGGGGGPAGDPPETEGSGPPTHAPPDYLDPPVNIPTPYRPPRQSTDTVADEDGRPGGGGGRRETRRGERFGETFEEMSPNEIAGLFDQARRSAAQEAAADDGCGRLFAGFNVFMQQDDEGPMMNEGQFMRYCEQMSPDMKVCFQAPEEQTDAQKRRCEQLLGTSDVFGSEPWGRPNPPADRRPSAEQLRRTQQLQRRARNAAAARMAP
jgi:hypothetical protein